MYRGYFNGLCLQHHSTSTRPRGSRARARTASTPGGLCVQQQGTSTRSRGSRARARTAAALGRRCLPRESPHTTSTTVRRPSRRESTLPPRVRSTRARARRVWGGALLERRRGEGTRGGDRAGRRRLRAEVNLLRSVRKRRGRPRAWYRRRKASASSARRRVRSEALTHLPAAARFSETPSVSIGACRPEAEDCDKHEPSRRRRCEAYPGARPPRRGAAPPERRSAPSRGGSGASR